jgi:predicted TIM-barrel fold metal-dependent hydrolase
VGLRSGRRSREPAFLDGLKRLADADLVLETANQNIALLEGALRVSDAVPHLRIVIDHLPAFDPNPADQRAYQAALRNFAARPRSPASFPRSSTPWRAPSTPTLPPTASGWACCAAPSARTA